MRIFALAFPRRQSGHFHQNARLLFAVLLAQAGAICAAEPAVDDLRRITARDLVSIADIGGHHVGAISVSPHGKYVAFQLQVPNLKARNYDLAWHIQETRPSGHQWKVDDGGDLILNPDRSWFTNGNRMPVKAQWSSDSEWLYYLKRVDDGTQLWRSNTTGSAAEQLTNNDADVLSFSISDDGTEIAFTTAIPDMELSTRFAEEADRGFLYDERFHPDKAKMPTARACGTDGEGRRPLEVGIERACTPPNWAYNVATRTERRTASKDTEDREQSANTASFWLTAGDRYAIAKRDDGSRILLINERPRKFPGFLSPFRLFASLGDAEYACPANECYGFKGIIEAAWWRPGRNEIIFQRADGSNKSMTGLYSWIPGTHQVRTIIQTEDQLSDCHVLESLAICLREEWVHPRTIASVDLDSGKIETIYDPNPEFGKIRFSKVEKIEWEDQFGNPTHGHLVYPLDYSPGTRYPLVITTYRSRGFLRGAVGDEYPIHPLAANGFMVLSHDMPRPFRRNATVSDAGRAQFENNYERRSSLSAQERILDILDERGLIDPDRVAITGLSDGAMQVVFALTHTSRITTAIASSAFDYADSYYSNNRPGRAYRRYVMGGAPDDDTNGLYKALSLGLNAERVDAPLLINVSDWELQNSVESFARLQDANKPLEMYVYPGEYHIKWQPQHRFAVYRRNIQWLKFWLMGKEEDEPVSPDQYARWRDMRDAECKRFKGMCTSGYCCFGR